LQTETEEKNAMATAKSDTEEHARALSCQLEEKTRYRSSAELLFAVWLTKWCCQRVCTALEEKCSALEQEGSKVLKEFGEAKAELEKQRISLKELQDKPDQAYWEVRETRRE